MRGRALFVTGTDTDVGKTWISSQLLRAWRTRALRVAALKAAESGCLKTNPGGLETNPGGLETNPGGPETNPGGLARGLETNPGGLARGLETNPGGLVGRDDAALFEAAGGWQPERCRFRFEPAVAPGVAAEEAGRVIDFGVIGGQVARLRERADRVIVEGAGGWLVPMGQGRTIEDLAVKLGLEVLIVARAGLGTINHSALTVRAVRAAGLPVAGLIMSRRPDDEMGFAEGNRVEIERIAQVKVAIVDGVESAAAAIDRLGI